MSVKVKICTFNNKGFPKMRQIKVNIGDYAVRNQVKPDILLEQERWFSDQLNGFRKIFNRTLGYRTYSPAGTAGTITAANALVFHHLAHFNFRLHYPVPYVCAGRKYTGEVCDINDFNPSELDDERTITYLSAHLTPSAWSRRFPDGSLRKRTAQREWHRGMRTLKKFAENQIWAGRDYVVMGIDANAPLDKINDYFGDTISGKTCQIIQSPTTRIDYLILIGNIRVLAEDVVKDTPSDHDPLWASVRLL